jgi:hypothetical protein
VELLDLAVLEEVVVLELFQAETVHLELQILAAVVVHLVKAQLVAELAAQVDLALS